MTIGELRDWGRQELLSVDIPSAALDADLLLSFILSCRRERLLIISDENAEPSAEAAFRMLIARRKDREPIAYLLGRKEFYGHLFKVSHAVLIPRPETEHLIEEALRVLKNVPQEEEILLLDVGTGSGAILLSLLLELPPAFSPSRVTAIAVDRSEDAIEVAKENAVQFGLEKRIEFFRSDLLSAVPREKLNKAQFALILANLPYIPDAEELAPEVGNFEPELALRGGEAGTEIIERFVNEVLRLRPCGRGTVLLEIGHGQREKLERGFSELLLSSVGFIPDLQGIDRIVRLNYREVCG